MCNCSGLKICILTYCINGFEKWHNAFSYALGKLELGVSA